MLGRFTGAAVFCLLAGCAAAQPLIYYRGIANVASYMPQGLPGGGIAQGSMFAIFGSGLGPAPGAQQPSFPLSTTLAGTSITVTQGTTQVNAIPVYASAGQVNAIMPSNAPLGAASVRVRYNGASSNPMPVRIVNTAFGIFAANSAGIGPGILQNWSPSEVPINAPAVSAQPGQTVILWGTGLGPVSYADDVAPTVGNLSTQTEVFVGGQSAAISYHGRASCCSGIDQINFVVPANAPLGCWVPVYVRTGAATVSNVVTMAIQTGGGACSDALNPFAAPLVSGGRAGGVVAVHATTHEDVGTIAPVDVAIDFSATSFYSAASSPFPFNAGFSLPPPGTCTVYTVKGDLLGGDLLPALAPTGKSLDAGSVSVSGTSPTMISIPATFAQVLFGYMGGSVGGTTISGSLPLKPGAYSVSAGGGADVGPFSVNLSVPQRITWTNRDQLAAVDRTQPLTIAWTGGGSGDVVGIVGFGEDLPSNASTQFACLTPPGASSFTIPPPILANLPPTRSNPLQSKDVIYLLSVPGAAIAPVKTSGLDTGAALFTYVDGKTVTYR